jgi:hypothetical protein
MSVTKYFECDDGVAIGDSILIKDDSGKATFSDIEITSAKTLKKLITAAENTFDNSTNGFIATNVQDAIFEARALPFIPGNAVVYYDDSSNVLNWVSSTSGTGANISGGSAFCDSNHVGVLQLLAGSPASYASRNIISAAVVFSGGTATYESLIKFSNLATVEQDFIARIGLGTSSNATDHADGIYFEYNRSVSANWIIKTASNSSRTSTTTSTPVTTDWMRLKYIVNADGTSVEFFINDVSVGTITTNITITIGRGCDASFMITKTAGTTQRNLLSDYYYFVKNFTNRLL